MSTHKTHPPGISALSASPARLVLAAALSVCALLTVYAGRLATFSPGNSALGAQRVPLHAQQILAHCASLRAVPGPPADFTKRDRSDRFEPGTNATHIRNATIWTGEGNGTVVVHGDLLLDKGIVKAIGHVSDALLAEADNVIEINVRGAFVTPGLGECCDLHSHVGVFSVPLMVGALDVNSNNGPILPWLRSLDAFNTHDDAFKLAIAGGVTSVQVLPGSGNAIGGQAFMMKLRPTSERSPSSMVLEPPHTLNGSRPNPAQPLRWRHMKQACGENLRKYGTRMDAMWSFREAYNEARKAKNLQDAYCEKAEAGLWDSLGGPFPENLKWEMLIDVLRGRVKISNHCYEAVDLDDLVRLTNEFEFHISSFHHASEAWLVPGVLNRTFGGPPAVAIFATNHRYKRESYRGSEFAPRVLAENGISVVMKSDHPVLNSRYLVYEAQQAHYFGLAPNQALASVTTAPATAAGLEHRIGVLRTGADADVVLWDSHPLQLGATPVRVWIDGIPQVPFAPEEDGDSPVEVGTGKDGDEWREVPSVPNFDKERKKAVKWEGLPPLQGRRVDGEVAFTNVRQLWTRADGEDELSVQRWDAGTVVVYNGAVTCAGNDCIRKVDSAASTVDLRGGSISPGLLSYGSPLGLEEISGEPSTGNGKLYEPFVKDVPNILADTGGVVRAVDALQFSTRNALTAYRSGVTLATSNLLKYNLFTGSANVIGGLSATFRTGAAHALESGAIVQDVAALHVVVRRPHPSAGARNVAVSSQIAALRRLLYGYEDTDTETGFWFKKAAEGVVPLVIDVGSADIMASLLILKIEVEDKLGTTMRMVFAGAAEAHLLAEEIGKAHVGVILSPARPFPVTWDDHRIMAGPPISNDTALVRLLDHGVTVGFGVKEAWEARNLRFDLGWAALESNGRIGEKEVYAVGFSNLVKLLGIRAVDELVAYEGGGAFELSSKVAGVLSPQQGWVDLF